MQAKPKAALVVTHRIVSKRRRSHFRKWCCLSPKDQLSLEWVAIGDISAEEIEQVIQETLAELNISIKSVKALCTIDLKKDEVGLA